MNTEARSTDALKVGDVVWCYGMRVLLDTEPIVTRMTDRTVYHFPGRVTNLEDVRAEGFVPASFLVESTWVEGRGWTVSREDLWAIQGNELATWSVEV